jgi:hypothetical protein
LGDFVASFTDRRGKRIFVWAIAIVAVAAVVVLALLRSGGPRSYVLPGAAPVKDIKTCETEAPLSPLVLGKSVPSQHIGYIAMKQDPSTPVTKFGGQPNWISAPQWPLSRSTGKQMTFIGQIALDSTTFPGTKGKMAYLFVIGDEDGGLSFEPWNLDAGENAVVIQPGGRVGVKVASDRTGPTSTTTVKDPATGKYVDKPIAYRVAVNPRLDQPFINDTAIGKLSVSERDDYFSSLDGDKIGGTPAFIQPAEFPCSANRLLLQIEDPPFSLNLGDGGDGYAFMNDDGTAGKFLTQSH